MDIYRQTFVIVFHMYCLKHTFMTNQLWDMFNPCWQYITTLKQHVQMYRVVPQMNRGNTNCYAFL